MNTHTDGPPRRTFRIDPERSSIAFRVRQLGVLNVEGHFARFGGTIDFDPDDLGTVDIDLNIDVASLDTGNEDRDEHLRSEDYFDAARYPQIRFRSTETGSVDVNTFKIAGELTIHDVTRTVVLEATYLGLARPEDGPSRVHFEARTTINRSDFHVEWNRLAEVVGLLVGDRVEIHLEIQALEASA